jgi:glycerol-3-phosphate dehydrogenase (NAD(P)+)
MKDSADSDPFTRLSVIGAGAWGTALAMVALANGRDVRLWAYEADLVAQINQTHENALYLPGRPLDPALGATSDLAAAANAPLVLMVTPAQHLRATLRRMRPDLAPETVLVLCAKGVEQGSLALMTQVAAEEAPGAAIAVLSGPGFAKDVARGAPTATTIACRDPALGARLVKTLGSGTFRPYLSDDLVGAEIGGALKNVIAIACGIAEGKGLGDGARAALITRGFAEMTRLGVAMGARPETMAGLCGLGDLVLTCCSTHSRNTSLGVALGQGRKLAEVLGERRTIAEGAASAPAVVALAARHQVELPICAAVDDVLRDAIDIDAAMTRLLSRPFRAEGV